MRSFKNRIVKKVAVLALAVAGLGFGTQVRADAYVPVSAAPSATVTSAYQPRSMDDLKQLTGPVALYPDALLAQVFTASTYPNDVVAAAQYLQNSGDPAQATGQGWDQSVQGLLQTPNVLDQLAANVGWMNQLGDAFLNQQQDVMTSVQLLRQDAQNAGNLATTPQQQVVQANNCIEIIPADPQVIYVPVYDPAVVYVRRASFDPCITFCPGIRVGLWLRADFDWCDHRIYFGDWGFNRPWWHQEVRGFDYIHSRPGIFVRNGNFRSTAWVHDSFRAGPAHLGGVAIGHVVRPATFAAHGRVSQPIHGGFSDRHAATSVTTRTVRTTTTTSHASHTARVSTVRNESHVTGHSIARTTTHSTVHTTAHVSSAGHASHAVAVRGHR